MLVIPEYASRAVSRLEEAGFESYVVGGCVRDALLGLEPHDWDIATAADPEQVRRVFSGERIIETGLRHGTVTLLTGGGPLEITAFRCEDSYSDGRRPDSVTFVRDVHEDLRRRDFTINAMAYSPARGLIDDFGGRGDLSARRLRCVGDADVRLREDALRILRALRFSARYGLTAVPETDAALRRNRFRLENISPERIYSELKGILTAPGAGAVMLSYPEIFFTVFPEMEPMLGFDQHCPEVHPFDVWEHTARAVDAGEPVAELRLALFFHDCGKPATFTLDPDNGRGHFFGHPEVGARMTDIMLRRLRSDGTARRTVTALVENHELPSELGKKAMRRLIRRLGADTVRLLCAVRRADAAAHAPEPAERLVSSLDSQEALMEEVLSEESCLSLGDLAIDGKDLSAMGLVPGPVYGRILNAMLEEVTDELLPNEREALLRRAGEIIRRNENMKPVHIQWLGHSCFRLGYGDWSLVIDPYADGSVDGLSDIRENADAVFCSHGHSDHSAAENVALSGRDAPPDFSAESIEIAHDHHGGEKRGMNLIRIFTFGSVRVVHMGDTGCVPGEEILSRIRGCDALLIPIGGFFTIGAAEAMEIVQAVSPRCVVPMHYRTADFGFEVLADPDAFIEGYGAPAAITGLTSFDLGPDFPSGLVILSPAMLR